MDKFRENHSGRVDQPLAHEAGVNHTINSAAIQLKAQNLRSANFLAHSTIGDLQEKVDAAELKIEENTVENQDH